MQLWNAWLEVLGRWLELFSSGLGLGAGLAIVVLALLLRTALLPVSFVCAYEACVRQKRMRKLQPEIERLRKQYANQPQALVEETMKLYRRRGLRFIEGRPILGMLVQMPVLLGMFSVLRAGAAQARFLWVANLSRPDFLIAAIAGVTTALAMLANPDLPEQARIALILVPSVIAFVFALKFASGLGLYWIVSNGFSAVQTMAVRRIVNRKLRAGTLSL